MLAGTDAVEVVAADEFAVAIEVHANLAAPAASGAAQRLREEQERRGVYGLGRHGGVGNTRSPNTVN